MMPRARRKAGIRKHLPATIWPSLACLGPSEIYFRPRQCVVAMIRYNIPGLV